MLRMRKEYATNRVSGILNQVHKIRSRLSQMAKLTSL